MEAHLVNRINELWQPIYPHLAEWVLRLGPAKPCRILEIGPFSGGISYEVITRSPHAKGVCAAEDKYVIHTIDALFGSKVKFVITDPKRLPFGARFNLVISRGAFFFLTPEMIKESHRVLQPGGRALLGGGYGPLTPEKKIKKIGNVSKELNYRLGKIRISSQVIDNMVAKVGLSQHGRIIEEGGLWLLISKEP
jgi:SAM-dependent methyltransferase